MPEPRMIRIKLLRDTLIAGQDGKAGEVWSVTRVDAATLVGEGAAFLVDGPSRNYAVTMEVAGHGDPAPSRVSAAPEKEKPEVERKAR